MKRCLKPVVLVGPMGAGKTTVGRALALAVSGRFDDMDDLIVASMNGMSIPDIFKERGEEFFRQQESRCLSQALTPGVGSVAAAPELGKEQVRVIAGGGGIAMAVKNRAMIKAAATCIYLSLPVEKQYERVKDDTNRPMLYAADVMERLTTLFAARDPQYREVADIVVDADAPIDEVVARCCKALKGRGYAL